MKNYRAKITTTQSGEIILCGSEDDEQIHIIEWTKYMASLHPEIKLLYHVPNGGSRNKLEAAKLKRMGVKPGVPDIVLPVPRGGYAGLYIELKVGNNKPTSEQKKMVE